MLYFESSCNPLTLLVSVLEYLPGETQEEGRERVRSLQDFVPSWSHGWIGRTDSCLSLILILNFLCSTSRICLFDTISFPFPLSCLLQFTSSHLSTNSSSGLGASIQSIPDYVYSQLSNPQVSSPEAKKLHQDIFTISQRGTALPPNTWTCLNRFNWPSFERTILSSLLWMIK